MTTTIMSRFIPDSARTDTPEEFVEEVGTLIFQSALMQQLAALPEADADIFNSFIENNVAEESFIEDLCHEYPSFEKILIDELHAFQSEVTAY